MKWKLILAVAIGLGALALPSPSSAAPATEDSVTLTGGPAALDGTVLDNLNATSGPSGENPSGQVAFHTLTGLRFLGPVTCLAVSGHTATINFRDTGTLFGLILTVQAIDNQPDTFGVGPVGRAPTDCSPFSPSFVGALSNGDITVVDAQPLPTTKAQCMHGGWQQFGFKNQGRCIRFVKHGAKN